MKKKKQEEKKDGGVFRRTFKRDDGTIGECEKWSYRLYVPSRRRSLIFSTGTADRAEAVKVWKKKRAEKELAPPGRRAAVRPERVLVSALLDAWEAKQRQEGRKGIRQAIVHANRIREHFGAWRAVNIDDAAIVAYIEMRRGDDRANSTINRELEILGGAFKLAVRPKGILAGADVPDFPHLKEPKPRQDFFGPGQIDAVAARLPEAYADATLLGYAIAWRKGNILDLRWEHVDTDAKGLRIPDSKNDDPQSVPLDADLWEIIERRAQAREFAMADGAIALSEFVFHQDGKPLSESSFLRRFNSACVKAGLGRFEKRPGRDPKYIGPTFHGLRRTAARDLIRSGVPQNVAMKIGGWKTSSVFDRYNIVDEQDKRDALVKRKAYVEAESRKRPVVVPFKSRQ